MVGVVDVTLRVRRYRPDGDGAQGGGTRWAQDYHIRTAADSSVLDCLMQVKRTLDPTLAFRYSCGHGMCGSDAVLVDGVPALLCKAKVRYFLGHAAPKERPRTEGDGRDADGFRRTVAARGNAKAADDAVDAPSPDPTHAFLEVAPLTAFATLRDLIIDIDPMLDAIKRMKPYLQAGGVDAADVLPTTAEGKTDVFELLQSPEQLAAYEQLTNCIACGVCEGGCPIYLGDKPFVGPAPLVAAMRFINDSRDQATDERYGLLDDPAAIWACRGLRVCTQHCPRGIDVAGNLWVTMKALKARKAAAEQAAAGGDAAAPSRTAGER